MLVTRKYSLPIQKKYKNITQDTIKNCKPNYLYSMLLPLLYSKKKMNTLCIGFIMFMSEENIQHINSERKIFSKFTVKRKCSPYQ